MRFLTLAVSALIMPSALAVPSHGKLGRRACKAPANGTSDDAGVTGVGAAIANATPTDTAASPSDTALPADKGTHPIANGTTTSSLITNNTTANGTSSAPVGSGTPTFPPGNKRGIVVLGTPEEQWMVNAVNKVDSIKWLGNYYHGPPSDVTLDPKIDFVPQMYDKGSYDKGSLITDIDMSIKKNNKYILAFGEAGTTGDYYMDAATAAGLWKQYLAPYAAKGMSVSAATNLDGPGPADWTYLDQFIGNCTGCDFGFLSFHDFGYTDDQAFERLKVYVGNITDRADKLGGLPVWVDNIQKWGTAQKQMEYLAQAIPFLENHPRVERYAYISPSGADASATLGDRFFDDNGGVTELGKYYFDFPSDGSSPGNGTIT
jgi:hypothetical protein